jgi:hypothetical protein
MRVCEPCLIGKLQKPPPASPGGNAALHQHGLFETPANDDEFTI